MSSRLDARGRSAQEVAKSLRRPGGFLSQEVRGVARGIVESVRSRGDEAVRLYTERFDGVRLGELRVPPEEIREARAALSGPVEEAFRFAVENVRAFHRRELDESWEKESGGMLVGQRVRPLRRAGLYVPGGHGAYPSTLVMSAVPARVAGVESLCVCSPAGPDGKVDRNVLAVCGLLGLEEVYGIGGAQAVGAMAFGTESVPRVEKIVGPGNDYVTAAKLEVFGAVGIDAPQGPSEIAVLADSSARPEHVARDLMAQAEHLSGASAILLTPEQTLIEEVEPLLFGEPAKLITLVRVEDLRQAVEISNSYAPEHAHVVTEDAASVARNLTAAGLVAVGDLSPVALSDYAVGPSHALPTGGSAVFASALGTHDFTVRTNYFRFEPEALEEVGPHAERLAGLEGFENHAKSIGIRRKGGG